MTKVDRAIKTKVLHQEIVKAKARLEVAEAMGLENIIYARGMDCRAAALVYHNHINRRV